MFRNYLTIAFRNLWKNKAFSTINIMGLAVGLATCLLIFFFVIDELSYDRYNTNAGRIYRIDADIQFGGAHMEMAQSPDPMGPTALKDFPQVEQAVRFRNYFTKFIVEKGDQHFSEDKVVFADSSLFSVFTLPLIYGDPHTALTAPNSIVLTETMALKYFNSLDIVGKSLRVNDTSVYQVTGVMKDMPAQSHFTENFFISMSSNPDSRGGMWVMNNYNTYVLLRPGTDAKKMAVQFDQLVDKYIMPQVQQMLGSTKDQFEQGGNYAHYRLMPLTDIHLHSNKIAEMGANSDIQYVYIFSAAAIFILLIACVNFMNLSTARSFNRAKEVGVRKALGSLRNNLIQQFLTESVLVSFIALVLALAMVSLSLHYFNALSGKNIGMHFFARPGLLPAIIALTFVVGLLAGIYPAFYLSSFMPIKVLKGFLASGSKKSSLRSSLVVFQFVVSIFLITGTIVIYTQLQYIRHKDIGFNREQVLVLQNTDAVGREAKAFRSELLQIKGVQNVTMTSFLPTNYNRTEAPMFRDATLDQKNAISLQLWNVDEHYIPTLGMKMLKGRNFSEQFLTDSSGVILNESAAKLLGYSDPLNKNLYIPKDFRAGKSEGNILTFHILGVIKDFNFNSLRQQVTPLAFFPGANPTNTIISIRTNDIPQLISDVNQAWKKMQPTQPFKYFFMDDDFNHIYNEEQRTGSIFVNFAVLAIFIACLGLFGLVTYAAEQRAKEIGIRKVLGASVNNIVTMLSSDFLKLVLIAIVIACPIAWWLMTKWLQGFSYRIHMSAWYLVTAGLVAVFIAIVTLCTQAIKAALANPAERLRSE